MEYGFYILYFCLGVLLTVTLLHDRIWPRAAISVPDVKYNGLLDKIETLQARLSALENAKRTKVDMVEILDALTLCRNEQKKIRETAIDDREKVSKIVSNLLASYRPRESKREVSA